MRQFYGHLEKMRPFCRKKPMSVKFLVLGGGDFGFGGGGGSADFIFMGARIFLKYVSRSDLILISFWMPTTPWISYPISFYRRAPRFVVFQTKVAHLCFCLVRKKMSLLIWRQKKTKRGGKSGRTLADNPCSE